MRGFHNAKSGRCFPRFLRAALPEGAAAITLARPLPVRQRCILVPRSRSQRRSPRLRRKQRKEQIAGAVGFTDLRRSPKLPRVDTHEQHDVWGGRFAAGPAKVMEESSARLGDRLRPQPRQPGHAAGSQAHVAMLARLGIVVEAGDADAIGKGLASNVQAKSKQGTFSVSRALEEGIPMNVESRLANIVGPAALGTCRPRARATTRSPSTSGYLGFARRDPTGSFLRSAELQRALAAARASEARPSPICSQAQPVTFEAIICSPMPSGNVGARDAGQLQGRPQAPQRVPAQRRR